MAKMARHPQKGKKLLGEFQAEGFPKSVLSFFVLARKNGGPPWIGRESQLSTVKTSEFVVKPNSESQTNPQRTRIILPTATCLSGDHICASGSSRWSWSTSLELVTNFSRTHITITCACLLATHHSSPISTTPNSKPFPKIVGRKSRTCVSGVFEKRSYCGSFHWDTMGLWFTCNALPRYGKTGGA